ncbi:hypothetical protein EYF80_025505 [Liparis tanakae]|uniref:Uncharacterized protein n=1 Tax=Liparis tanakae TaxID=230148 RepID=A0A4Z2HH82_9TELE|nr:hypothetical protein EYF80_025505 [Liparis tanakae]
MQAGTTDGSPASISLAGGSSASGIPAGLTAINKLRSVTVKVTGVGDEELHTARAGDGGRVTRQQMDLSQQQALLFSELPVSGLSVEIRGFGWRNIHTNGNRVVVLWLGGVQHLSISSSV